MAVSLYSQNYCVGYCDTGMSTCYSDTLSNPSGSISLTIEGDGFCCAGFLNGNSTNYNCAQLNITVPPGTEGLEFAYNGPNQCAIDVHDLAAGCPDSRNNGSSVCDPFCPSNQTYCEGEPGAQYVTFVFTLCKEGNFNPITLDIIGVPKACLEVQDANEDCDVDFFVSENAVWSANPASALNYLSCLDCTNPTFSYNGPAINDCNGVDFEYTITTGTTLCDSIDQVTRNMTVYPTLDGTISNICLDECRTELSYVPFVDCSDIVYYLTNGLGDTLDMNSSGVFDVPSDNTFYYITASRPGTPSCWNTESYLAVPEAISPNFTSIPADVTLEYNVSPFPDTLVSTLGFPTALDNCDPDPVITYYDDFSSFYLCGNTGTINRVFVVTDDCGNSQSVIQEITIEDNTDPIITNCPPDVNNITGCDTLDVAGQIGGLTYNVNWSSISLSQFNSVGGDVEEANSYTIMYKDSINDFSCPNPIINVIRTFMIIDDCGGQDVCTQNLEFYDYTEPSITCPPPLMSVDGCDENDVTAASTGLDYAPVWTPVDNSTYFSLGGTINDVCGFLSIIYQDAIVPDQCPQAMLYVTRTFIVTDQCANTQSCQQTIEVYDLSGPVVSSHPDITVDCDNVPPYTDPVVSDACYTVIPLSYQQDTVSVVCDSEYELSRTWVFEDDCGNQTTHIQLINVIDTVPPVLVCPGSITLVYDASCLVDTTLNNAGFPLVTDVCSSSTWSYLDDLSGINDYNGHGTIVRTFIASDDCGNSETCFQYITLDGEFCGDGCPVIYTNGFIRYNRLQDSGG